MNSLWTTPWLSKKQISLVLIFDFLILAFFRRGELLVCHSELCRFLSGSYSKIHVSSPVMTCLNPFCHFRCVQEGPGTRSFGFPSVHWWEFSGCPIRRSKFCVRFGDSDSTHYWSFCQTSIRPRDPSLWSHFRPFLTCKFRRNEVRLAHCQGHP